MRTNHTNIAVSGFVTHMGEVSAARKNFVEYKKFLSHINYAMGCQIREGQSLRRVGTIEADYIADTRRAA